MAQRYYADLNPAYPSRYAKRWAVFMRQPTGAPLYVARAKRAGEILQYTTRKAAERKAAELNARAS